MEYSDRFKTYQLFTGLLKFSLDRAIKLLPFALLIVLPCNLLLLKSPAIAEAIAQSPTLSKNTVYVDPQIGDDSQTGKKTSPLKTITQALAIAEDGSTIQLAPGTYSEDTGETFPIVIEQKITLKGDPQNQGYKTVIQGDGYFTSPTGAGQNAAIAVLRSASTITGITVSNNHSRGHGVWIESANPKIIGNTLTRNGNTGVSINGKSFPSIENNYFYNNSGNGLLVYGSSQAQVANNTFEQTGFAISLVQESIAEITDNLFDGNRIGIILEGKAQGTFRNNEIINSRESGLTAIANSRVDLGTDEEPGNNTFRSNKNLDIQNATDRQILAVGTQVQGDTQGSISFERGKLLTAENTNTFKDLPPLPDRSKIEPLLPKTSAPIADSPSNLPAPPPIVASNRVNKELVFAPHASDVDVISDIEPVPFPPQINNSAATAPSAIKYKVLVEVLDRGEEDEVRSLYPEAFQTIYQGEPWLQVGAFGDWDKAKRAEQNLIDLGLGTYLID